MVAWRNYGSTLFFIYLCCFYLTLSMLFCRYIHEEWLLGETMCRLYPFFFYGNVGASLINMVAITINR